MCGIGCIYLFGNQKINQNHINSIDSMSSAMLERGPDAFGSWYDDGFAVMHRRLSIVDIDAKSNQPMESKNWILSFNGEIVNYKDLKSRYLRKEKFKTDSDSEVLLLLIEKYGITKTLKHIAGMFAFIAYNKINKEMFIVRDPLGIKPVVYTYINNSIVVASSIKALIDSHNKDWAYDLSAIGSYFTLGANFLKKTFYQDIEKIDPGSYIKITKDKKITHCRYWEPKYKPNFKFDDMCQVLLEYQESDVKSALLFSGGIDSTFLASLFNKLDNFHLVSNETKYAELATKKLGKKIITVRPSLENYSNFIKDGIEFHGEPLMSMGIPFSTCKEMHIKKYKMGISGNGADELFFGYPRTLIGLNYSELQKLSKLEYFDNSRFYDQISHIFRDKSNFSIPFLDDYIPSIEEISQTCIEKLFLKNFPLSSSYRWIELMTYVLNDLNPTLDAASMKNSVEMRVPFLDHRIVEGILSWESGSLISPSLGRKSPLKQYLKNTFDDDFLHRPKLGFSIHKSKLGKIESIGKNLLNQEITNKNIYLKKNKKNHARDHVYLRNSLYSFNQWLNLRGFDIKSFKEKHNG